MDQNNRLKFLFVDFTRNVFDKHPIYSISSIVKELGHDVDFLSAKDLKKSAILAKEMQPDICLYSCFTPEIRLAAEFDKNLKEIWDFKSLIGGPGPTYEVSEINKSTIDFICIGEGEIAIREWVKNNFNPIKNIIARGEEDKGDYFPVADLSTLPFPDRDVIYNRDSLLRVMPSKQFMAGRGCPYRCTYCHNHVLMEQFSEVGPKFRYKEVDYLIDEILDVKSKYPLEKIVFQDDVFILDRKWLREFADKYPKKVGIPFACNVRANLLNETNVSLLKEAGCESVSWSIESGNEFIRNKILSRNMSNKVILNASKLLNQYEIIHRTGNIVGIPGEKIDQMLETLELNIQAKPYLAMAYTFVPFPGLALTDFALRNGFLKQDSTRYLPRTFFGKSVLNFKEREKVFIANIANLFPAIVRYPFLYENKSLFKIITNLPVFITRGWYHLFNVYLSTKMFKVRLSPKYKIMGLLRYLESGM